MILPSDIYALILTFATPPTYKLGGWVNQYPIKYLEHFGANPHSIGWIRKRIPGTNTSYPGKSWEISKYWIPNLIKGLCSNTNPKAIQILEKLDIKLIASDSDLISNLLKKPEASEIIEKIFNLNPKIFKTYQILESVATGSGSERLLKFHREKFKEIDTDLLAANSSDIALDIFFVSKVNCEDRVYECLSSNSNTRALEHLRNSSFGQRVFTSGSIKYSDRLIVGSIISKLAKNPNKLALGLVEQAFSHNNLPDDTFIGLASNPAPRWIEWVKKNFFKFSDVITLFEKLASNPSDEAFELFLERVGPHWHLYKKNFIRNISAIGLIKNRLYDNEIKYESAYYANPGIYRKVHNPKLARKLATIYLLDQEN